ncbi:MAG TPA: hypothetical protein VKX39_17950 [Bryobacteraceae bacterium]|jgi:hypothetical protein|nr:hypothetical protein [Bryobacteraceae bacterium]
MQRTEAVECPFCLDRMEIEDRDGALWLVCPNGCATEVEAPVKKPAAAEAESPILTRAAARGSK